jgi:superfamily II DNA or RNA helicase
MTTTRLFLSPNNPADYATFLAVKKLPRYRIRGGMAEFPTEYAHLVGKAVQVFSDGSAYKPWAGLFDYQRDISAMAIRKRMFSVFADCGLGKTLIALEFARHANYVMGRKRRMLIVAPLMVVRQTCEEAAKFYGGKLAVEQVRAADLQSWLDSAGATIGITNYEAITDGLTPGKLGGLVLDESSMLKSQCGRWGTRLIELGRGLEWKLCLTGTPAPNDRIEYANHAVFMGRFPTVNAFLAKYFINRGETNERWELKAHGLQDFYRSLSDWAIFLSQPAVYGWQDNSTNIPPIHVHIHDVPMTDEQTHASQKLTGGLFSEAGGFVQRGKLARLAKGISETGNADIETHKPKYIADLIAGWPDESTIVWCNYNREQDALAEWLPGSASISGDTPVDERYRIIDAFKAGEIRTLISKPKVLGFGLNLQVATRMVFSSLVDSYEQYYQAVKRSNRVGSTRPLNVHIPVTEIERAMVANVLRKSARVQADTEEQERLFQLNRATGK